MTMADNDGWDDWRRELERHPALLVAAGGAHRLAGGARRREVISTDEARASLARKAHLLCHAAMLRARLGAQDGRWRADHLDVAELFAFCMPAHTAPVLPSAMGRALGLTTRDDDPAALRVLAEALLRHLAAQEGAARAQAEELACFLHGVKWPWAPLVMTALDVDAADGFRASGLAVWERLAEWQDPGPRPPAGQRTVSAAEAERELVRILGHGAEERADQRRYAAAVAQAFAPRPSRHENTILLAEAGTGLGKTLGYLAPAALWARRNAGAVWIATYTRNLQRQLKAETRRLWPEAGVHRRRVAVRKGRENYLCLLNAEERFATWGGRDARSALFAALVARWALATADGDMVGGDFPAWLMPLFAEVAGGAESPLALGLTDRRGECTYAACRHFRKCFIEKMKLRAQTAELVIANHAVVLSAAAANVMPGQTQALAGLQQPLPARLVFDEGHHLFDAADSAFSGHLTALEAAEMRRWVRGPEGGRRRGRGLRERLGDMLGPESEGLRLLQAVEAAARCLPGPNWRARLMEESPATTAERFLLLLRAQVLARTRAMPGAQELETDCHPLARGLREAAEALLEELNILREGMRLLAAWLARRLETEARELSTQERNRLESMARAIMRRGELVVGGWCDMLQRLLRAPAREDDPIVAWFALRHAFGQEMDMGMHAHWVDPTRPLAECVLAPADSVVITSATLRDRPPNVPDDWQSAETRTGAQHLPWPARRVGFPSPFDYARQARVLVVEDVNRDNPEQLASAFRALFIAAGGGALGLFTAISRLRAVHERIAPALAEAGLPLFAQHVDPVDIGTLVDIFRDIGNGCLLGTDAVRDGMDVPGPALRLMVMERVPWPRPTILERARRQAFGGQAWTDMQVRLRLRQAFGRLIRKHDDTGVFVMLDARLASRFHSAFPDGVAIHRVGLAQAVAEVESIVGPGR